MQPAFIRLAVAAYLTVVATAATAKPKVCAADNCLRAVTQTAKTLPLASKSADCISYIAVTSTPAAVTITTTVTAATATSTLDVVTVTANARTETAPTSTITATATVAAGQQKRQLVNGIPKYASACSGAVKYSSACSCFVGTTYTVTAKAPTVVITVSATSTATRSPSSTVTPVTTVTPRATVTTTSTSTPSTTSTSAKSTTSSQAPLDAARAAVNQCLTPGSCGKSTICSFCIGSNYCTSGVEGQTFCAPAAECSQLQACNATVDCPAGFLCAVNTCCKTNVCQRYRTGYCGAPDLKQ